MTLTPKQRLLRAILGQEVDHVPFSPFLAYYFEELPEDVRQKGQLDYLERMGADPLLRGFQSAFSLKSNLCTKVEKIEKNKKYVTIHTPNGRLYLEYTFVTPACTWFLTKHPVVTVEDLYMLKTYYQDLTVVNEVERLNEYLDDLGERALHATIIGTESKSSFQSLLESWVGTENLIYLCADYPDEVLDVITAMSKVSRTTVELTASSKSHVCISWEDSSTTNLSPALYHQYIAPEITAWCNILKDSNIHYIQHACGHVKDLLIPMAEQGITGIESLTPDPTGNVSLEDACAVLPANVSIIGGIDPIMMLNSPLAELEDYVHKILKITKNRGFVLSNSDSCPPGVSYDVFLQLAKIVKFFEY